eukprot:XP_016868400.1 uncharacterized protein LOC107986777 isoform X2 [Homo sapiens]
MLLPVYGSSCFCSRMTDVPPASSSNSSQEERSSRRSPANLGLFHSSDLPLSLLAAKKSGKEEAKKSKFFGVRCSQMPRNTDLLTCLPALSVPLRLKFLPQSPTMGCKVPRLCKAMAAAWSPERAPGGLEGFQKKVSLHSSEIQDKYLEDAGFY